MKEFFHYFFGAGENVEFENFSLAHFIPLILLGLIIFLIIKYKDKLANLKFEKNICLTLAFIAIITEMSYFWRLIGIEDLNANPVDHLPITVCGWTVIFCSFLAATKNQTLYDISYFWLFSGTIFALIMPTVITYTGPTRFRYYQFWLEHSIGYIIIFYMTFVHKMRPTFKSLIKSYVALFILAVVAYFANRVIGPGANYLYMAKPEDTPSILDILPKVFWLRALIMACAVTVLYAVSYLPWYLKDRKQKKELK